MLLVHGAKEVLLQHKAWRCYQGNRSLIVFKNMQVLIRSTSSYLCIIILFENFRMSTLWEPALKKIVQRARRPAKAVSGAFFIHQLTHRYSSIKKSGHYTQWKLAIKLECLHSADLPSQAFSIAFKNMAIFSPRYSFWCAQAATQGNNSEGQG